MNIYKNKKINMEGFICKTKKEDFRYLVHQSNSAIQVITPS